MLHGAPYRLTVKRPPHVPHNKNPYPSDPSTLGDWLRRARLDRRMSIKDLAVEIGTTVPNISNWESNRAEVSVRLKPRVYEFIGLCPYDASLPLGLRLRERREYFGLITKELAKILCVNPNTISSWERAKYIPTDESRVKIRRFLRSDKADPGRRNRQSIDLENDLV